MKIMNLSLRQWMCRLLLAGWVLLPGFSALAEENGGTLEKPKNATNDVRAYRELTNATTEKEWEAKLDRIYISRIEFQYSDIDSVLLNLGTVSSFDIVVTSDVEGEVTTALYEKTLRETLNAILLPHGWQWKRVGGTLYVSDERNPYFLVPLDKKPGIGKKATPKNDIESIQESIRESKLDKIYQPLLEFNDSDIRHVLTIFEKISQLSISYPTDLGCQITALLWNMSLRASLDSIMIPNGLEWKRAGETIYVDWAKKEYPDCPILLVSTETKDSTSSFHWRMERNKPTRLVHGWYTIVEGVVAEYAGGGVSVEPSTGPMNLYFSAGIRNGQLNLSLGKSNEISDGTKSVQLASHTAVPEDYDYVYSIHTWPSTLTSHLTTLWECRCVRDGTVVKTIRYAARVADASEAVEGFKPPADLSGEKPSSP